MKRLAVLILTFAACASAALADEAAIRKSLEPKMSGVRIDSVKPSPISGLYEVQFTTANGAQIVYSDPNGNYIIQTDGNSSGQIIDLKSGRNLTEEKLVKLNSVAFDKLPFDEAVKVQRGNGKRTIAMFSDPYCPYCRRFEKSLQDMGDVTVYVFMYPVIRPDRADDSRAIWCSADRSKAWVDLALNSKLPTASPTCDNPVDKTLELGRKLRVQSTPTIILQNGERISGALGPSELRAAIDRAAASAPAAKR